MTKKHLTLSLLSSVAALALVTTTGCESSDADSGSGTEHSAAASGADAVAYSSLNWTYGGVSLPGAVHSGVTISGLSVSGSSLSFTYDVNISAWGASSTDASKALACAFVKNSSGQWVGGKFDWISSSRSSRGLEHVTGGYNGWSLSGVPNPTEIAFVIVSPDGTKRSNVLTGTWQR